jgi:cation transporter-like permease
MAPSPPMPVLSDRAVSVTFMTPSRYRRPLMIFAAVVAVLSLAAVAGVMAFAFAGVVAPAWVTYAALYGLPLAFLLMLFLVLDSIAGRRRAGKPDGR